MFTQFSKPNAQRIRKVATTISTELKLVPVANDPSIDRAEIRSLTTNENLEDYWCEDPVPTEAAEELGFAL